MNPADREDIERQIAEEEKNILESKKKLVELRKRGRKEAVKDYTLTDFDGRSVKLSDLFGEKDELIIIHNMGTSCRYCTLWADGFNGILPHLENRVAFAVVSPDEPKVQKEFAESREWKFRLLSAKGTDFIHDMGFESKKGDPQPGVSAFSMTRDGRIHRNARSYFGPRDDFCSLWHLFDLLPRGFKDWEPQYKY
jgi:predicted dithiol-disulfide oxidoreductase (DUF899 family)